MLTRQLRDDVYLRLPEPSDAQELYELAEANRDRLEPWMPWIHDHALEKTQAFVAHSRKALAESTGLTCVVVRQGRLAGSCGLNLIDWLNKSAYIGYWLAAEAEGEGIMTAAVEAFAEHAFGTLGLHRLDIRAGVENHRSRAVAERCGFTLEGELRDAELVGGRWITFAVYGRLAVDGD